MPGFRHAIALLIIASVVARASAAVTTPVSAALAGDAKTNIFDFDELRRSYVELQRDSMLADRSRIVPGNSQIAVYVSMDPRATARLAGVSVEVNGAVVGVEQFSARRQPRCVAARRRWSISVRFLP